MKPSNLSWEYSQVGVMGRLRCGDILAHPDTRRAAEEGLGEDLGHRATRTAVALPF